MKIKNVTIAGGGTLGSQIAWQTAFKGFIPENEMKIYSFNNVTAKPNEDGSITINFGGCEDRRVNCIPVSDGWDYLVQTYEPNEAVTNGIYEFPEIKEVK